MQHIPEKHFKMISYYGIYARHSKIDENLHRQRAPKQCRLFVSFTRWREAILLAFGYDPIQCPNCKITMEILEIYHNHHRGSLQELYKRAYIRYRAKHCIPLLHSYIYSLRKRYKIEVKEANDMIVASVKDGSVFVFKYIIKI